MKTIMQRTALLLLLAAPACLGACSLIETGPPLAQVLLDPKLPAPAAAPGMAKPLPLQIAVPEPSAGTAYASDRIAAVFSGFEIRYQADARWNAPAPRLVQRLLMDSMENTGIFSGVGDGSGGMRSDLRLLCDIRRFGLRYTGGEAPVAEAVLTLRLMDARNGRILASLPLSEEERAGDDTVGHHVLAFNAVLERVLAKSGTWVAGALEGFEAPEFSR